MVEKAQLKAFESSLIEANWQADTTSNKATLQNLLDEHSCSKKPTDKFPQSEITPFLNELSIACQQPSLGEVIAAIRQIDGQSKWLSKANKTLANSSQLSALLIFEQLKRFRYASLEKVFGQELSLATNVVRYPEFSEGVRALLIDKDNAPKWAFEHFSDVPSVLLESFFTPPWPENPLIDLLDAIDATLKQK